MLQKTPKPSGSKVTKVTITPPNFLEAIIEIEGTSPYVMNSMSSATRAAIVAKQEEGSQSRKGRLRPPKDFDAIYKGMMHVSTEGWYGMPASAFRAAMISACRTVGFKMTVGKLSLFVIADGIDNSDGQMLVRLEGKPTRRDLPVKLADGSTDILPRPFFDRWSAKVRVRWDADQFTPNDIVNLMNRVGTQVGIGAGRHDSKQSTGMGWGCFKIKTMHEA
jgi:hypothetical protein